jgi:hypothetical protein
MLHYRRTGLFARGLVRPDGLTPRQRAFAYGYLSHVAADVVGHPYVNSIVGAPYRLNVQRHVTAENFQDSWKFARYYGGESINRTLLSRMGLPDRLPTDVGDLLDRAFHGAYGDLPVDRRPRKLHNSDGFYTRAQIDETYDVFYRVLKLMESMAVERPTEPFSGAADILADALDAFTPPPSPPDPPSSACSWTDILAIGMTESSRDCYNEFFEELESWLDYLGELIAWTLQSLMNLIDLVLALLLSLPICVLLALLYGIQLLCYQAYRSARLALATTGFLMPEPDELETSIGRNLITLADPCARSVKYFPSRGTPPRSHLVCPTPDTENPVTWSGLRETGSDATPDRYICQDPFSFNAWRAYALANGPGQTRSLQSDRLAIGNATDLTAWMIANAHDPASVPERDAVLFAHWNLDADRGYGYRAWSGDVPHAEPYEVADETYSVE